MSWVLTLMFCSGRPADEGQDGPDRVRRLAREVERQLTAGRVPVGDAAARLDRRDVDPRDVDVLFDPDLGRGEVGVGGGPVTGFPVPDVVVLLVRAAVGAKDERAVLERLVRVDDDRERLVVDQDGGDTVGGDVLRRGDDRGDLLRLVHDRVRRKHHLLVAGEGRHPVETGLLEVCAGDDRQDARDLERLGRVDALDRGVGVRAADDVEPELARQVDVVDVLALAADHPRVFLALDRVAHATHLERGAGGCLCRHLYSLSRPRPVRRRPPGRRPIPRRRLGRTRLPTVLRRPAGSPSRCSRSRCSDTGCR